LQKPGELQKTSFHGGKKLSREPGHRFRGERGSSIRFVVDALTISKIPSPVNYLGVQMSRSRRIAEWKLREIARKVVRPTGLEPVTF
jgi:hypothetical protein